MRQTVVPYIILSPLSADQDRTDYYPLSAPPLVECLLLMGYVIGQGHWLYIQQEDEHTHAHTPVVLSFT